MHAYPNLVKPTRRYLIGLKANLPYGLELMANLLCKDIIDSCRNKRCPFCGKRFKRLSSLAKHLSANNPCSMTLSKIVDELLSRYYEARLSIHKSGRWLVMNINGHRVRSRDISELYTLYAVVSGADL